MTECRGKFCGSRGKEKCYFSNWDICCPFELMPNLGPAMGRVGRDGYPQRVIKRLVPFRNQNEITFAFEFSGVKKISNAPAPKPSVAAV